MKPMETTEHARRRRVVKRILTQQIRHALLDKDVADLIGASHGSTVSSWRTKGGIPTGTRWLGAQEALKMLETAEPGTLTSGRRRATNGMAPIPKAKATLKGAEETFLSSIHKFVVSYLSDVPTAELNTLLAEVFTARG